MTCRHTSEPCHLELRDGNDVPHWYGGYTVKGPQIVDDKINAFTFSRTEHAENVKHMDERLQTAKIVPV
jgi:hypothetical protein